jgi:hypothetical protein
MKLGWIPRQLPIRVRPVHRETVQSYLARLARLNHIHDRTFLAELVGTDRTRAFRDPHRLSVITGYSPDNLTHALPELRSKPPGYVRRRHGSAPACPQCTRGHLGGIIQRFFRDDERICLDHLRWAGPGIRAALPHNLHQLPDVSTAARRHLRVRRRHDPDLVDAAVEEAEDIIMTWLERNSWPLRVEQRLDLLLGSGHRPVTTTQDAFHIAIYPDVVALAAILVSPHWRRLATTPGAECRAEFFAEVCRRFSFPPHRFSWSDPLTTWANTVNEQGES